MQATPLLLLHWVDLWRFSVAGDITMHRSIGVMLLLSTTPGTTLYSVWRSALES